MMAYFEFSEYYIKHYHLTKYSVASATLLAFHITYHTQTFTIFIALYVYKLNH